MEKTDSSAWDIWFSLFLIVAGIVLFTDAGPAGIQGSEVGTGFLPKVAAVAMIGFAAANLWSGLRHRAGQSLAPAGSIMALVLLGIGILGVIAFQQLGLLVALFLLFFTVFSLFEKKMTLLNLGISLLVAYAIHGFFIGLLGIWDPAGSLVDLGWLTPW